MLSTVQGLIVRAFKCMQLISNEGNEILDGRKIVNWLQVVKQ